MAGLVDKSQDGGNSDSDDPANEKDAEDEDVYLEESSNILLDFISITNRTADKSERGGAI